ncbi:hypothetical protein ACHWQZ_G015336 [Mnemiopsis leidyi]
MNDLNDKKKMTEKKEAATRKKVVQSPEKTPSSSDYECLCPCKKYIVGEFSVGCEQCEKFWHYSCVGLKGLTEEMGSLLENWLCPDCFKSPHSYKEVALSSSKNDCVENRAVREIIKEELQLFAPKLTQSLNDVINGSTEKTVNKAVHLYSEVTAKSQKKVIEDLSTAQASENVISKVQTKMHTDAYERNLRKLNLCVVKVPESNKATSKQRQEDDAKFCLETLKIEKRDFISCHRAGDFNLPNVSWDNGTVKRNITCKNQFIMTQQEFMDIFNENGLTWYFTNDTTRRRLVKETLQESLLDQVLYTNDALVNGCKIVSPLGRSDHVGIMVDLVVSPSADTSVKQKVLKPIWGKVSSEKLLNISINDINWDYSSTNNVQDMWAELHCKLEAVAATVPAASVYLDNRPVKLPWSSTALKRMRKNKDRAWAEFDIDPSDINLSNAMSKQHTFEEEEFKAKVSYEKKITSDLKHNSKAFYAYLRNKRQVKSSVVSLDRGDGTRTDTSAEAAEVLATAFSSVFVHEPPGPLPKSVNFKENECVIDDLEVRSSDVKKQLLKLNIFKSSGPDGVHPKLLKSLAYDDSFVEAVTQLFVKCSETGTLPEVWKSASVVALFKKVAAHGNWATVLELESVQRRFTRLIDEVGTLPYSRRLEILNLTTLAERRIRGDLIEAFKATSGLTDYGSDMLGGSGNDKERKMDDKERYTFEVSWEVCNKVGGINTVIRSKAAVTVAELGDNYYLLGPHIEEKMRTEVEIVEPSDYNVWAAVRSMRDRGIRVVTGRWLIAGNPWVILFDLGSAWARRNEWMTDFWNVSHISIPDSDKESVDCVMFGELVTWFLGEFNSRNTSRRTVAHFHEWQAGVGCVLARTRGLDLGTIFTTHATLLGRYLCAGSSDFYNNMPYFDCEGEARRRGIHHRYCMEMAACHAAHIFTTVSRITQDESEHLLKRRPDLITPNGLNVHKFSAIHEFQNLHAKSKKKIEDFVQGHFYGHVDFDLENTIYMFSAGRNEYFNKGVDLFLEGLAKLNYFLKRDNVDVTVIAFLIFPEQTNNYNIDSLNGQAQHKKLKESVETIQKNIGDRIFQTVLRGQLPTEKLLTRDDEVLLKNYLYQSKRTSLPPIVTHNLTNEPRSDIMNHIKRVRLFNNHSDKVKVIYHPEFLSTTSPLLNIDYPEFVRGCHLGVFPSYYEPWGYTPAECTVMGIPSITTNLSGFGCFMAEHITDPTAYGIYIVDRRFKSPAESVEQLANQMLSFAKQNRRQRIIQRNRTERLSDLMDWNSLGEYYVRARHMALKALDVTYNIPPMGEEIDVLQQGYKSPGFKYPRPASQPPSPSQSRRSSVEIGSDEENEDRQMIENITKRFGAGESKGYGLGEVMDMKQNVLGEAMTKIKTKEQKKGVLKQLAGLSEVRPDENVSLIEVNMRNELVQSVNKEIKDISGTKEKKKSLLKEVELRGEQKENKTVLLAELGKLSKLKESAGAEDVNLVNIHDGKRKKDAAMNDIALIGKSKELKASVQRELTTISQMRDAKADAMQEIRDRNTTKDNKRVVMKDISKMQGFKDARIDVLSDIHRIGSINATVFSNGKVCEPLPKVYSGGLSVIKEINERGQLKETKSEALKELVTKHDAKTNKAAAMTELRDISDSKVRKEAAMQEIKDREVTKEVKGHAMAELKKVADIKEKVGNVELPVGAAEKAIAVHSKAMKDITTIGKQKDTKNEALKEMMTICSTKEVKEKLVGEIGQIGQARTAKEAAHLELRTLSNAKENKENMQNELINKTDGARQNVLSDIEARGKETDQGRQNVADMIQGRANQMNVLSDIKDIGKEKEEGIKNVEALFAAKSTKTDILTDIRQIREEKEQGRANVEKLLEARGSKSGAMAEIRQIKEEKDKGIQKLEQALGNRPPSTSE